jgi:hypothetical protein
MAQKLKVQLVEPFSFNPWLNLHFGATRDYFLLGISEDNLIWVEILVFGIKNSNNEFVNWREERIVAVFWMIRRPQF